MFVRAPVRYSVAVSRARMVDATVRSWGQSVFMDSIRLSISWRDGSCGLVESTLGAVDSFSCMSEGTDKNG